MSIPSLRPSLYLSPRCAKLVQQGYGSCSLYIICNVSSSTSCTELKQKRLTSSCCQGRGYGESYPGNLLLFFLSAKYTLLRHPKRRRIGPSWVLEAVVHDYETRLIAPSLHTFANAIWKMSKSPSRAVPERKSQRLSHGPTPYTLLLACAVVHEKCPPWLVVHVGGFRKFFIKCIKSIFPQLTRRTLL